jgi:hypothetical protein
LHRWISRGLSSQKKQEESTNGHEKNFSLSKSRIIIPKNNKKYKQYWASSEIPHDKISVAEVARLRPVVSGKHQNCCQFCYKRGEFVGQVQRFSKIS